ncbi:hypothetical protein [Roseovarius sp. 217]|uniref:hypothetical protein n=1 Tax=Roseovarius sp. (strain 217) TaxID=314264 RepID=UPI00032672AF|nr:hypothetical protein [Roseovarius sp. 217]
MIEINNAPWFVAVDVCRALDVNIRDAGGLDAYRCTKKHDYKGKQNLPYLKAKWLRLQHIASRDYGIQLIGSRSWWLS